MKKLKTEPPGARRLRLSHLLLVIGVLYLVFISFKFPRFLEIAATLSGDESNVGLDGTIGGDSEGVDFSRASLSSVYKDTFHRKLEDNQNREAPVTPKKEPLEDVNNVSGPIKPIKHKYGRITGKILSHQNHTNDFSMLEKLADEAWTLGLKAWEEVDKFGLDETAESSILEGKPETCPSWISTDGKKMLEGDGIMFLPCGLAAGSSITIIGTPHHAHQEYVPQLLKVGADPMVMVSQFMVELQGLKAVDGEDPPKILHLNPRLKGDWSKRPVIEHNTCYRMQWGTAQRCDGMPSSNDDEMLGEIIIPSPYLFLVFSLALNHSLRDTQKWWGCTRM